MADGHKIMSAVQQAFMRIGTRNGHAFPESELYHPDGLSNEQTERWYQRERAAFELMVADEVASLADKRRKAARAQADDLGLTDGVEKLSPGSSATLYTGQVVSISATVNNPVQRVDAKKMVSELRKQGVNQDIIDKAVKAATVTNAPAKKVRATPVL